MYHHCAPAGKRIPISVSTFFSPQFFSDFNEWSKFCTGDPSGINWSYDILQPYLLKAERFKTPSVANQSRPLSDLKYRGTEGVWETRFTEYNVCVCRLSLLGTDVRIGNLQWCRVGLRKRWYTVYQVCLNFLLRLLKFIVHSDFNTPRGTLGTSLFPGFVDSKGESENIAVC